MKTDILIVGAGFAGAAAAWHLSRSSDRSILILEREDAPGRHASGRNAALVLQSVANPLVRELTRRSCRAYTRHAQEIGFRQVGSIQTGPLDRLRELRQPDAIESRWLDPQQVRRSIPPLTDCPFQAALHTPSDGVMDVSRLLGFYLSQAESLGVKLLCGCEALSIEGSGPFRVSSPHRTIETEILVDAAGAWAGCIGRMAGASHLPLNPLKRHLFQLGLKGIDPRWPFVWDLERDFYFRPEADGLLFSICDESPAEGLDTQPSPGVTQRMEEVIRQNLPALRRGRLESLRACYRTHTVDGLPIIGQDAELPSFFWVAGLGGYGMGASWAIGEAAAEGIARGLAGPASPFDPARLAAQRSG